MPTSIWRALALFFGSHVYAGSSDGIVVAVAIFGLLGILFELHVLFKAALSSDGWVTLLIGLATASVTAFAAIYALLHYLEKRSTWIFVWYRLLFGIGIVGAVAGGYLRN